MVGLGRKTGWWALAAEFAAIGQQTPELDTLSWAGE